MALAPPFDLELLVRHFFFRRSLNVQLVVLSIGAAVAIAAVATAVVFTATLFSSSLAAQDIQVLRWRLLATLGISCLVCLPLLYAAINRLLRPLYHLREAITHASDADSTAVSSLPHDHDVMGLCKSFNRLLSQVHQSKVDHDSSKLKLADRTRTVDRLLEFSQNIQGAGKPDQVSATLCHSLQAELGLAGLTVLSIEPEQVPATQVRASCPDSLLCADRPVGDMDTALCPCVRQHLPRHFRADGSPVRCAIDNSLSAGPDHSAYCIPFTLGGKVQAVIHMLMPPGREWTEAEMQLAQTYVNSAQSALISLHLLGEAEKQSMTDGLTGLYNRRSLESLMQREVAIAERHRQTLSLVMIDMDKFKEVNDTYGHAAGDHLLKAFAECVRMTLRKTDMPFRYGGDEFLIALPQTNVAQAQQVVQKLRQAFMAVDFTDAIARMDHQPTLSIGVAERSVDHNILTLASLLAAADQALYDAKAADRNCTRVYQPNKAA